MRYYSDRRFAIFGWCLVIMFCHLLSVTRDCSVERMITSNYFKKEITLNDWHKS